MGGTKRVVRLFVCSAIAVMLVCGAAWTRDIRVSPAGTPQGDGSKEKPLDLATALHNVNLVGAGDTVWLAGGTYIGPFTKSMAPAGTKDAPIIYRAAAGERVTITAPETESTAFHVNCSYVWFWGLEISVGGKPLASRGDAIKLWGGDGIKLINLVVHDNPSRTGIGGWDVGNDHEYYGCLVYRNGLGSNSLSHGMFVQNSVQHGTKRVTDCLVFNNFGWGVHCYSESVDLSDCVFEGVTSFGNGMPEGSDAPAVNFLVGGKRRADRMTARDCYSYFPTKDGLKRGADFGYSAPLNGSLVIERCVFAGGLNAIVIKKWSQITFKDNICFTDNDSDIFMIPSQEFDPAGSVVDGNTYYKGAMPPFSYANLTMDTIEEWRAKTGWDKDGGLVPNAPKEPMVYLRPNKYEPEKAYLIAYNWPKTADVSVDLGRLWNIKPGQRYSVVNAEDIWAAPVAEGAFDGKPIAVRMTGLHAPEFACYIVTVK